MDNPKEQCSSSSSFLHEISSHPLFSILTTFSLLTLLYSPHLLPLLFSPVLISTSLLLTTLFHFSNQNNISSSPFDQEHTLIESNNNIHTESKYHNLNFQDSSLEWSSRGGPLEVIYEEYEGEGEDEDNIEVYEGNVNKRMEFIGFYDTEDEEEEEDSDSDSSSLVSENMRFRWEEMEEGEGEGMIEIAFEEDNLIEIDLRTCR